MSFQSVFNVVVSELSNKAMDRLGMDDALKRSAKFLGSKKIDPGTRLEDIVALENQAYFEFEQRLERVLYQTGGKTGIDK